MSNEVLTTVNDRRLSINPQTGEVNYSVDLNSLGGKEDEAVVNALTVFMKNIRNRITRSDGQLPVIDEWT